MRTAAGDRTLSRRRVLRHAAVTGLIAAGALPNAPIRAAAPVPFLIGDTVQGRPIRAVQFGSGPARVVALGGIHTGIEINTVDLVATLADYFTANPGDLPAAATLTLIPALNMDGVALGTHVNAREVDLNRNWPARWQPEGIHGDGIVSGGAAPLSEPETAALSAFLTKFRPHAVLSWHSDYPPSGEAEGNSAALGPAGSVTGKTLARAFAESASTDYLEEWIAYPITGHLLDTLADLGIPGVDIELPAYTGIFFAGQLAGLRRVIDEVITALR